MLKKIKTIVIKTLKVTFEIIYEIIKKFIVLYYVIFILGLLISIKNKTVNPEVIIVSMLFLMFTQIYYKNYKKVEEFLNRLC
ncbi:MAG: hypothetical protein ACRCZR_06925 [Cetobacterium sp.]